MFKWLFKKRKRVIIVYLNVGNLPVAEVSQFLEKTATNFKNALGEDYTIIVLETRADTRVELLG